MRIKELIELLKAMHEKMEGFNSEGELVVLNTHKASEVLKKSLRNCDVGTADEHLVRHRKYCLEHDCEPIESCKLCFARWSQMPYEEGGEK